MDNFGVIFFIIVVALCIWAAGFAATDNQDTTRKHIIIIGNELSFTQYCDTAWNAGYQSECDIVLDVDRYGQKTFYQTWWKWE